MNHMDELREEDRRFLTEIFSCAGDDPSASVSMYEIGEGLGMDRQQSSRIAEALIASGLVDLRSLSGTIALTSEGREAAGAMPASGGRNGFTLGGGPLLDGDQQQAIEMITADLKQQAGKIGLDFDALAELVADLKTIQTQLGSPRPKTAIVRACFESIRDILESDGDGQAAISVKNLLSG